MRNIHYLFSASILNDEHIELAHFDVPFLQDSTVSHSGFRQNIKKIVDFQLTKANAEKFTGASIFSYILHNRIAGP